MICRCVTESRLPGWVVVRQAEDHVDYEICPDCDGSQFTSRCDAAGSRAMGQMFDWSSSPLLSRDEIEDREAEEF